VTERGTVVARFAPSMTPIAPVVRQAVEVAVGPS
jgi:hypothetical protein